MLGKDLIRYNRNRILILLCISIIISFYLSGPTSVTDGSRLKMLRTLSWYQPPGELKIHDSGTGGPRVVCTNARPNQRTLYTGI